MKKKSTQSNTTKKDTTTLRIMNWVFAIALISGSLFMIFNATLTGTLYLLLFLLLGAGIIITAVTTGQFVIVVLGFIFTLLSFANVKALDICVKELSDV